MASGTAPPTTGTHAQVRNTPTDPLGHELLANAVADEASARTPVLGERGACLDGDKDLLVFDLLQAAYLPSLHCTHSF